MKKLKIIDFKLGLLVFLLLVISFAANAQKLPKIQKTSLRAPDDIKIDGNAVEWGDAYQAYSNATEFFYTIANSHENLYLVVHATDHYSIQKIVYSGITFGIINPDKKSYTTPVTVTYPIMPEKYIRDVSYKLRTNPTQADLDGLNKIFTDNSKVISVTGITEITDKSISIYNEMGIKAAQYVDDKKGYTIEMAIPLKYLKELIDDSGLFNYKIFVNGWVPEPGVIVVGGHSENPSQEPTSHENGNYLLTPTYLKGAYTLAKQ